MASMAFAASDAEPAGAQQNELARHFYSHFSCAACHRTPPGDGRLLPPLRGPVLDGLGRRVRAGWVRRFLADPQAVKPGSPMPDMLAHMQENERAETVENLTHFLMTGGKESPAPPKHGDPVGGARRYRSVGCAACHGAATDGHSRKYAFSSLTAFLIDPLATHPDGRMPSLRLSRDEAADIAAYLLQVEPGLPPAEPPPFAVDADRAEAGRRAFDRLDCAACHTRSGAAAPRGARSMFGEWGATSPPDCGGPPVFTFTEIQRHAMATHRDFIPLDPGTTVAATMRRLNCYACHARGGTGGPTGATLASFTGDETLGDEGRFPPHLDGVGRKLNRAWMKKVLDGSGAVRPYLDVRMPDFGAANVAHLPSGFEAADTRGSDGTPPAVAGDIDAGHKLMGVDGGMGCITCHGWGKNPGVAMRGIDLTDTVRRLRFGWFKENLINPQRMRPGTLMPSFWPGGESGNPNVLDGDTDAQIAALWAFLDKGKNPPVGIPDAGSGEFEIIPRQRAVVQRGFITPGGTSAIAVGFPQGVHFIYSADTCRPVAGWRGRFLDGYNLWFSRLDPRAAPLGNDLHRFADGSPAKLGDLPDPRFKGYRLDPETGGPTFLFESGDQNIEDTFKPTGDGQGLIRTVTSSPQREGPVGSSISLEYRWPNQ